MAALAAEMPKEHSSTAGGVALANKSFEQLEITNTGSKDRGSNNGPEEGVEVVLGETGADEVVDSGLPRPTPDQNVFRGHAAPHSRSSARGGSYPNGPPPPPYSVHGSGSFGYGRPYERPPRPYSVPTYNPSGSYDDGAGHYSQTPSHYSPHVQYPRGPRGHPGDDFNVISPNHKSSDPKYRSSSGRSGKASSSHYQYPPTSPVGRTGDQTASPPRLKNFAARRTVDGPYSKATRSHGGDATHPEDGTWNPYPAPSRTASGDRPQPPLVAESSFDSDHFSRSHYSPHPAHPPTPGSGAPHPHHDPAANFYGPGGSWGSFESAAPHRYDEYSRPPHRTPSHHYPESPYSPYSTHSPHSTGYHSHYSPGGYYAPDQYGSTYHGYAPPQSYEEHDHVLKDYHPDRDGHDMKMDGKQSKGASNKAATGCVLPAAAHEIDFDVTDPPAEPVCPPSTEALVESLADVNHYDVLCGRGGGTNSQVGNKRFRTLVQDFQPTYLLARRKEKPLLARTIVLIIRKRGGRFLRKDEETGMLYEVGDAKAEAKTSQALREGLDVRATKSATSGKKKKKKAGTADSTPSTKEETIVSPDGSNKTEVEKAVTASPASTPERPTSGKGTLMAAPSPVKKAPASPPSLPKLADEEIKAGMVHPHSPEAMQFRKRRRMRSLACGADKFFPDFCPPRAELGRGASPTEDDDIRADVSALPHSPMRRTSSIDDEDAAAVPEAPGCTGAVLEIVAGAVTGGLCFGPK